MEVEAGAEDDVDDPLDPDPEPLDSPDPLFDDPERLSVR